MLRPMLGDFSAYIQAASTVSKIPLTGANPFKKKSYRSAPGIAFLLEIKGFIHSAGLASPLPLSITERRTKGCLSFSQRRAKL
jgi:hypothetical protein